MKRIRILVVGVCFAVALSGCVVAIPEAADTPIEPEAANWGTWVLSSSDELRPDAPPNAEATAAELAQLQEMVASVDDDIRASIDYWNAGAPNYRWLDMMMAEFAGGRPSTKVGRSFSILNVAIYDAVIATWDAKYTYNRARPSAANALIEMPTSPSYPSEHAAAAGAAAVVMGHIFPEQADFFMTKAEEAAQSRVYAGVHYPSDVEAGLALGKAIGEKVVAHAQDDGFEQQWTGEIPTGPGIWQGDNPMTPLAGTWKAWTLSDNSAFRAPPPPAHDSAEIQAQLDVLKAVEMTPAKMQTILYRGSVEGAYFSWIETAGKHISEHHWDENPPLSALIYATMSAASFDSIIACFDTKYAYWYIRPSQLDPTVEPRSGVPPHPSYPAAAACNAIATAEALAGFFPAERETFLAAAEQSKNARVWSAIHYPMDVEAGHEIGISVADAALEYADALAGK